MMTYYLNIGSNLDDREGNLWAADLRLSLDLGLVVARSSIIESEPWGFESDNGFLNMGIAVESQFSPIEALNIIHDIEYELNHGHGHRDAEGNYRIQSAIDHPYHGQVAEPGTYLGNNPALVGIVGLRQEVQLCTDNVRLLVSQPFPFILVHCYLPRRSGKHRVAHLPLRVVCVPHRVACLGVHAQTAA